jgi:hypothetical protein
MAGQMRMILILSALWSAEITIWVSCMMIEIAMWFHASEIAILNLPCRGTSQTIGLRCSGSLQHEPWIESVFKPCTLTSDQVTSDEMRRRLLLEGQNNSKHPFKFNSREVHILLPYWSIGSS